MEKQVERKYHYSEIFHSIQGEGHYTGVPTAWLRFFLCNLQCNGFGQVDPTNPDTYELPFEDFDVSSVKRVEDLPVWEKGCDSSYTWAKKFKGLMGHETPTVLANKVVDILKNESNPDGKFLHPVSKQNQHLCFTGGEPLMVTAQAATMAIYKELQKQGNVPGSITYETNGTQILKEPFKEWMNGNNSITIIYSDRYTEQENNNAKKRLLFTVFNFGPDKVMLKSIQTALETSGISYESLNLDLSTFSAQIK